ncbi:hypothetical protein F5Y12DRAFT_669731 [Xylaria sp. FL1777]|nr:hypothetical protein F5Y12DRAFT_669731 [Xylaria sp. FL1777]
MIGKVALLLPISPANGVHYVNRYLALPMRLSKCDVTTFVVYSQQITGQAVIIDRFFFWQIIPQILLGDSGYINASTTMRTWGQSMYLDTYNVRRYYLNR